MINDIFEKENESTEDLKVETKSDIYPNYKESPNKGKNSANPNPHGNLYSFGIPNQWLNKNNFSYKLLNLLN